MFDEARDKVRELGFGDQHQSAQDIIEDDYSKDEFDKSMGIQTHDELTPKKNFSSMLKSENNNSMQYSPRGESNSPFDGRDSPVLSNHKRKKEPILKGLHLKQVQMQEEKNRKKKNGSKLSRSDKNNE